MSIRGTDVYYQSNDVDRAIEFYRDTLGLELYGYYEDMKRAEINAGNTTFAINDPSAFDPEAKAQTGGGSVAFAVDNLEGFLEQLQAKGVKVTVPMNESPVCHFACIADPDVNTIWLDNRKDGTFGD